VQVVEGSGETLTLASITRLVPPPLPEGGVWDGSLEVKLDMERNQDGIEEWKLNGDTRVEHGRWRQVLRGKLERERQNDEETEDNRELEYDLDCFLTDHWFWRAGYEHQEDRFEGLTRLRILGTGPGYRFWDNELGRLDPVGQVNRVRLDSVCGDLAFDTWSMEWDYQRLLWGTRLELYSVAEVPMPQIARSTTCSMARQGCAIASTTGHACRYCTSWACCAGWRPRFPIAII
jgi:hypothetical protein